MSLFNDRERAFALENASSSELAFRARLLSVRLMAEWAAARMALGREESSRYIDDRVRTQLRHDDEASFLACIRADMRACGMNIGEGEIRAAFCDFVSNAQSSCAFSPSAISTSPFAR